MNKEEFLRGLQNALSGEVPPTVVRDNLRYYDDYIRTEVKQGKSEEQVMDELGDPRLIARTIIDTTPGGGEGEFEEYRSFGNFDYGSTFGGESRNDAQEQRSQGHIHYYDLNKWYWKAAGVILLILFVMLIVMLISGFLSIMIPLLPFFMLIMVIMCFFRGPKW